jgi:hypothetical protein
LKELAALVRFDVDREIEMLWATEVMNKTDDDHGPILMGCHLNFKPKTVVEIVESAT